MRGRLRRKLARQRTRAKVRLVIARIIFSAPSTGPVKDWRFLSAWEREDVIYWILFRIDFSAYRELGHAHARPNHPCGEPARAPDLRSKLAGPTDSGDGRPAPNNSLRGNLLRGLRPERRRRAVGVDLCP